MKPFQMVPPNRQFIQVGRPGQPLHQVQSGPRGPEFIKYYPTEFTIPNSINVNNINNFSQQHNNNLALIRNMTGGFQNLNLMNFNKTNNSKSNNKLVQKLNINNKANNYSNLKINICTKNETR